MMKIHTDKLTSTDLYRETPPGVYVETLVSERSQSRRFGFRFRLEGSGNRRRNSGQYGAEYVQAATYDEHGIWMARLFDIDPQAIIGQYKGRDDFHRQTEGKYRPQVTA